MSLFIYALSFLLLNSNARAEDYFSHFGNKGLEGRWHRITEKMEDDIIKSHEGLLRAYTSYSSSYGVFGISLMISEGDYYDKNSIAIQFEEKISKMVQREVNLISLAFDPKKMMIRSFKNLDSSPVNTVVIANVTIDMESKIDNKELQLRINITKGGCLSSDNCVQHILYGTLKLEDSRKMEYIWFILCYLALHYIKSLANHKLKLYISNNPNSSDEIAILTLFFIMIWDIQSTYHYNFSGLCTLDSFPTIVFLAMHIYDGHLVFSDYMIIRDLMRRRFSKMAAKNMELKNQGLKHVSPKLLNFSQKLVFVIFLWLTYKLGIDMSFGFMKFILLFPLLPQIIVNIAFQTFPFKRYDLLAWNCIYSLIGIYFRSYPSRICYFEPKLWYVILYAVLIIIQISILSLQNTYGPRFMLNKEQRVKALKWKKVCDIGTPESEDPCSICLGELNYKALNKVRYDKLSAPLLERSREFEKKVIKTACNHEFHPDCCVEWIVKKGLCPICRQKSTLMVW